MKFAGPVVRCSMGLVELQASNADLLTFATSCCPVVNLNSKTKAKQKQINPKFQPYFFFLLLQLTTNIQNKIDTENVSSTEVLTGGPVLVSYSAVLRYGPLHVVTDLVRLGLRALYQSCRRHHHYSEDKNTESSRH